MIIKLPFSGFYDSIHSNNVEYELNSSIFTDHDTRMINNDRLTELAYDAIDWAGLYLDYAREYVDNFNNKFDLNLVFESMSSPKEYNFTTDRIFCEINEKELKQIVKQTNKESLVKMVNYMFTSRDGFSSYYDNDYSTWGKIKEWDFNQLHCLLMSWLEAEHDIDNWYEEELYLMDDSNCNGFYSELIYKHCSDKRLFKIADYLNVRLDRKSK